MSKYILNGMVTISVYTEVEANSKEEAINIALQRDIVKSEWGSPWQKEESWVNDEYDGEVTNIEVEDE